MEKGLDQKALVEFTEGPRFFKFVLIPLITLGNTRSIPAEVGITIPKMPVKSITAREHPQEMSITAGVRLKPLEPENNSTLVQEYPPELMFEVPVGQTSS